MSARSEAFSLLVCLDATKFVFLKGLCHPCRMHEPMKTNLKKSTRLFQVLSEIFGRLFLSETICLKIWSKSRPRIAKRLLLVDVRCLSSPFYFSVGITNIIRSQDKHGRKTVQFDLHEEVPGPFFGYPSKVHVEVPMTVKEIQENEATHTSTTQFHGWSQFDQEFRFSNAKEGGMMLEKRCQYTSAKVAIRYIAPIALTLHKDIMENTRKYFMEVETKNS